MVIKSLHIVIHFEIKEKKCWIQCYQPTVESIQIKGPQKDY